MSQFHYKGKANSRRAYIGPGRRPIEEPELEKLLGVVRDWRPECEALFLFACDSGLRVGEVLMVKPEHVQGKKMQVPMGKGNVSRWTVVTDRTLKALAVAMSDPDRRIRTVRRGSFADCFPGRVCSFNYSMLTQLFIEAKKRAGLAEDLSWHCLRHRFATKLLRSGLPLNELSDMMGHRWLSSTAVYLHLGDDRFQRATDALEGRPFGSLGSGFLRVIEGGDAG